MHDLDRRNGLIFSDRNSELRCELLAIHLNRRFVIGFDRRIFSSFFFSFCMRIGQVIYRQWLCALFDYLNDILFDQPDVAFLLCFVLRVKLGDNLLHLINYERKQGNMQDGNLRSD